LTLGQLVGQTARRLAAARLRYGHGTGNARDEAFWLVLRGLGLPFDADLKRPVSDFHRIESLVRERTRKHIPLAYLLNEAWLAGVPFYVDRRVIVPRSHISELLGERWLPKRPARVLDLCTGSGCLAVLAAKAFPKARVDASDISKNALAVARINVRRHRLGSRIRLLRSDLYAALKADKYDLIVSNPPYVAAPVMSALPQEYRHEPRLALAGGADGIDFVARVLADAPAHLKPGGLLMCEVGDSRGALKRAYPRLPLMWPRDEVFVYRRELG
jgi:ribosomal protein L3 glutamine methyltransferase